MPNFTDLPNVRPGLKLRAFPRSALAWLCAASWILPISASFAQEAGLRGTVNQPLLAASQASAKSQKIKKGTKKTKLPEQEMIAPPLERYQPGDLEAMKPENTDGLDSADAPPVNTISNSNEPLQSDERSLSTAQTLALEKASNSAGTRASASPARAGSSKKISAAARSDGDIALEGEVPNPSIATLRDSAQDSDLLGRSKRDNQRTGSIEGKKTVDELNPFDAPGIRAGTFVLRPTFEAGLRTANNPNDPTCDCPANRVESSVLLRAESDWRRHALNVEAKINLRKAFSNTGGAGGVNTFENGFRLAADGRIDASAADQISASASVERTRETLELASIASFSQRPMVDSLRGSVGYTHDAGRLSLGGALSLTRQIYSDAFNLLRAAVPQSDRNYTNVNIIARAGYEMSPALSPFVELELGRRQFDNKLDSAGLANSATRYALRVGTSVDLGEKLRGELAGGWFVENVDETTLKNVSGFDLRGSVNWSPMRDTSIALAITTQVEGARSAASSTSVVHSGSVTLTRRLRDNLDANALVSIAHRDFQGSQASQTTLSGEIGGTWWFNRFSGVKGSVQHSGALGGASPGARSSTSAYLGVILRR